MLYSKTWGCYWYGNQMFLILIQRYKRECSVVITHLLKLEFYFLFGTGTIHVIKEGIKNLNG